MVTPQPKVTFLESWRKKVQPIQAMDAVDSEYPIAILEVNGSLSLLDSQGKSLFSVPTDGKARFLSLSQTCNSLLVLDDGSVALHGPRGESVWKKRGLNSAKGVASLSGNFFALITHDPTVILMDQSFRSKWTYRNLLKTPSALAISGDAQTVAFGSSDERGEGVITNAKNGKPYDPFMGLNPIKDIVLSQDGEIMVAINSRDEIICINCVKGFGIWKENLKMRVDGISYASGAAQTLLYSCHGKISILDNLGKAIWEQQFPFSLLRACISFDGQFIWFASSEGIVGLLRSRSGRDLSRIEFSDFEILSSQPHLSVFFKKSWRTELEPPRSGEKPLIQSWVGPDGVEYVILWNGSNALLCLNDCGEEVFKTSLLVGKIFGMSVSPQADLVILVSDSGIIGFRLDGSEVFRFLGDFSNVHLFESGSFALLQSDGKCRIYLNNRRFSHVVDVNYDISSLCGSERVAFLFGDNNLTAIDSLGNVLHSFSYAGKACFHEIDSNQGDLLFGTEFGEIILLGIDGNLLYRNILSGKIIFACFDQTEDLIFAATQGVPDLVLVQNRTSRKGKIRLNGKPVLGGCHKLGVAVGTELDDIVFVGKDGCIQGRYSSADHLVGFVGSRQGEGIYVLAEGSISRFATSPANEPKLGVKIADLT